MAVELAAARLRALPLSTLAERLDDRFRLLTGGARTTLPRQQTLRAVVDWSYDLLFEDERKLFARLSVFAGGCELAAAEVVCADDEVPRDEILDILSRLVDKSLVTIDIGSPSPRYSQLRTLWQYARERLTDLGGADDFMNGTPVGISTSAWRDGPGFAGTRESNGVRSWRRSSTTSAPLSTGSSVAVTRLLPSPWWAASPICGLRADFHEGYRWSRDALSVDDVCESTALRGYATAYEAYFGFFIVGPAAALETSEKAVADLRVAEVPAWLGAGLLLHFEILTRLGEFDTSQAVLAEAHPLLVEGGDPWDVATHDMFAARNLAALGRPEEAELMARASVELLRASGDQWMILYGLGTVRRPPGIARRPRRRGRGLRGADRRDPGRWA